MLLNGKQITDNSILLSKIKNAGGQGTLVLGAGSMIAVTDAPTAANHVANKAYVDGLVSGINFKDAVRVATTAHLSALEGTPVIDDIQTEVGDRVLVKNQSGLVSNGVWVVVADGWVRAADVDSAAEMTGCFVFVDQGTVNGNKGFVQTETIETLGADNINFTQFTAQGSYSFGDGFSVTGQTVDLSVGNGLEIVGGNLTLQSSIAGSGLSINASKVLSVDAIDLAGVKATGILPTNRGGIGAAIETVEQGFILAGTGENSFAQHELSEGNGIQITITEGDIEIGVADNGIEVTQLNVTGSMISGHVIGWNGSALAWIANPNTDNQQLTISDNEDGSVDFDLTGDSPSSGTIDFNDVLGYIGVGSLGDVNIGGAPNGNEFLGYSSGSGEWVNKRPNIGNVYMNASLFPNINPSSNSVNEAMEAIDAFIGNLVVGTLDGVDIQQQASAAGNDADSGALISATPKGYVMVYINGMLTAAHGDKTGACYFTGDDGASARDLGGIEAGDKLFWISTNAGFSLESTDIIDLVYET